MNATDAETRDQVRKRDATISREEVRFTNPSEFIEELTRDAELVVAGIVRVTTENQTATRQEVAGRWIPGAENTAPGWTGKNVAAAFWCRGQLVKLSVYCGVVLSEAGTAMGLRDTDGRTTATALRISEMLQKLTGAIDKLPGLQRRGGGIYFGEGEWVARPDETIEAPPKDLCATCGEEIYHANDQWRHKSTKRAEVTYDAASPSGRTIKKLHHLADPLQEGRVL